MVSGMSIDEMRENNPARLLLEKDDFLATCTCNQLSNRLLSHMRMHDKEIIITMTAGQ